MNTISQAKELPKLAKQLMTYRPHSRVIPRFEAVKLWREIPEPWTPQGKAMRKVTATGSVNEPDIVEERFTFKAIGTNRVIVTYEKEVVA
jgi:hypothetical protein